MSNERKRHVIPGEVITSGPYRAEQNTIQVGDNIGLSPSLISGRARLTITLIAYERYDELISSCIEINLILLSFVSSDFCIDTKMEFRHPCR